MYSGNRRAWWDRLRVPLMLAPAMVVLIALFGSSTIHGLLQSLGWQPLIGRTEISLRAYANLLGGEAYAAQFWTGLLLTLWISLASTVLSAALAVATALAIRRLTRGRRVSVFLLHFNLPIPHIVAAVGILFLLSQSGLLPRLAAQLGLIAGPSEFPVLVRDRWGLGIILAYVWKEVAFIGIIVLAVLQAVGEDYENVARTLGANAWQRFRYVLLPLMAPALLSSATIVFAFVFGAYETAAILGVRYPRPLAVTAVRLFLDADLNARAEAMAMSVMIALIVVGLVVAYRWVSGRRAEGAA